MGRKMSKLTKVQYRCLVKNLIYLARTKSNYTYTINMMSQFMHDHLRVRQLQNINNILQYLKVAS